jgi:adenine-specific DNA-methyltransferase
MKLLIQSPKQSLNKAYLKEKISRSDIELFKKNLSVLLDKIKPDESEEHHKNLISDFLKDTWYKDQYEINTKGREDLVIYSGKTSKTPVGVIMEVKKPNNKAEMISEAKPNSKALHELILYYLQERIDHNNIDIKYLIITNINEWFIFDEVWFEKNIFRNIKLKKDFENWKLSGQDTRFFYESIAAPFLDSLSETLICTSFDIRDFTKIAFNKDKTDDNKLIALYKILSPVHLLKKPFVNDSNSLDKAFYSELLHIIGLTETKEGGKKLIERKKPGERDHASLIESAINQLDSLDKISRLDKPQQFGANLQERLFNISLELAITWVNRILFLKLLEAQLIKYHKGDKSYAFLNSQKVQNFDDLNSLFFSVLARQQNDRIEEVKTAFANVPYLNSSLFEPTEIEQTCFFISQLKDSKLPIFSTTVLKEITGKKRTGILNTLEYFFEFLNAYDFSSEGSEDIQEDNKTLISASVLGLIFEKINGYKDGSFFTPSFITMYMCRETIRRAIVQKFNDTKGWTCTTIDELFDNIKDKKEANTIINSLKICDPAVGSGHFLVSALNEIITVKSDLKILLDRNGKTLRDYQIEVVNDELIITDDDLEFFEYNPKSPESQRIQETLFHEKQNIIENCLFGVDINPNSVKICRLRLWIELLKNAYYKGPDFTELETLPNIDINIKCGNSLISRYALDADIRKALKRSKWSIDSYRLAVMTYRNAQSKDEKREMERLINEIKNDFETEISTNDKRLLKLNKLRGDLITLTTQTTLFEKTKTEKASWNKQITKLTDEIGSLETELEEVKSNKIYENAFEWRFEFPEVLNDEGDFIGFDVVIGNPPYGNIFNDDQKKLISNNYLFTDYQFDIYMVFFELAERILRSKGKLTFIIPNTWLLNLKTPNVRKLLFNNFDLLRINAFEEPVFEEAVVDTLILIGSREKFKNENLEIKIQKRDKSTICNKFNKLTLAENYSKPVNIYLSETTSKIINLIGNCSLLEEISKITQGTKPFQVGKGIPKQTLEILRDKPYVKDYKVNETYRPLLRGSLMNKYCISWNNNYFISFGDWLAEPRYSANYDADKKIVIRQTGSSFIATVDYDKYIVRDNLYTIISTNSIYSEEYLLGLLNSRFLNWYYQNVINNEVGEALAQVKKGHLCVLPIALPKKLIASQMIEKVIQVIEIKKSSHKADTTILESEIDQLVYELYGLTAEGVKIVESYTEIKNQGDNL